jgi:leucyl-tRNA synthetase
VNGRIDWNSIESKWIKKWEEQKAFEADPDGEDGRKKYFVTVAYPYPNSPQHIGHGRTYTLADVHARYMRMKGYNVLFPMGFHYTGTPILGMSRRVSAGDPELMETFLKIYKLTEDVIATFVEPVKIASFFHHEIKSGMKEMGYSIDWRREFTTIDKMYSKFIAWQFRTLRNKGLIVQGTHLVGWCPRDQNPVSQHDTIGDVEPDFEEYTLIKFRFEDKEKKIEDKDNSDITLPAATLRPETIFGVTNIWVNPKVEYVLVRVDDEKSIMSKEAARKQEFLDHEVEIIKTVKGSEMIGLNAINPVNNDSVPIYPASFVEADSGSGIVMSVPAHAPYDYQYLEDLKFDKKLQAEFHIWVDDSKNNNLSAIKIIETESYSSDIPSEEAINQVDASSHSNQERLDEATSDLYSSEFYKGIMMHNTGRFVGMSVAMARNEVKKDLVQSGMAGVTYELVNKPVRCRCGAECVVKLLNDQWFLNYNDKEWKELAHECVSKMDILPHDIRQEFDYVIDWLRERACARKLGLGTKLPWDKEWTIESLSDSVIYMAYYIIAKYVNCKAISGDDEGNNNKNNNITDAFFDYVLLGEGSSDQVAKECRIPADTLQQIRNEFNYFYPVDSRHSGRDLVPNHLTFFIFNHVAIFEVKNWPRQIVVNGSVLMEGKKMSKSLGNIIPLRAAIKEYGADTIRLAMLMSAEILQDADFSFDTIRGIRLKLLGIFEMVEKYSTGRLEKLANKQQKQQIEDRWLLSRLQRAIAEASASMDRLRIREAIHHTLYSLDQDLQWYLKRSAAKGRDNVSELLRQFLNIQIRLLAPSAPFTAEEVWERMGNVETINAAGWPKVETNMIDADAEESEFLISNLLADLQNIVKVTKITPTRIVIYTSASWKIQVYRTILSIMQAGRINFGEIMKQLISNPETAQSKADPKLVHKMVEDIRSAPLEARSRRLMLTGFNEITSICDAQSLLSSEINKAQIVVYSEEDPTKYDPKSKAKSARPFKPAILIE